MVTPQNSFERYITQVRSVWGEGPDPQVALKVKALLENLLRSTSTNEPWMARLIGEGLRSKELYHDPDWGFIQMGHNQPLGHGSKPHEVRCWLLYGVYRGSMEITTYRRANERGVPGDTTPEKLDVQTLTSGIVVPYFPGDIHSTFAIEPWVVFRFLSFGVGKTQR